MTDAALIDGKAHAARLRENVAAEVARLKADHGLTPALAVVLVGEDPASQVYVGAKGRQTTEAGMDSIEHRLPASASQDELLDLIATLNADPAVHGILVQLPLPKQVDADRVLLAIDPAKDVDGFHPTNVGMLATGQPRLVSCTPAGLIEILKRSEIPIAGKRAVVLGRSNIVGKPAALLLLAENATVTVCHSRTQDLPAVCREADILVAAVGQPRMVKADWIKPGAAVMDVGVTEVDGKLIGDVDFEAAHGIAGLITPSRRGIGPLTITMLLRNTLHAYRSRKNV